MNYLIGVTEPVSNKRACDIMILSCCHADPQPPSQAHTAPAGGSRVCLAPPLSRQLRGHGDLPTAGGEVLESKDRLIIGCHGTTRRFTNVLKIISPGTKNGHQFVKYCWNRMQNVYTERSLILQASSVIWSSMKRNRPMGRTGHFHLPPLI